MGALINTLMNLPLSVPVVAGWGFWLATGLVLLVWARRAHETERVEVRSFARPAAKSRAGVKTGRPSTDAFGELQAMLEPEPDLSAARRPGD